MDTMVCVWRGQWASLDLFPFSLVCHCVLQTNWPLNLIFYLHGPFLIRSFEFQDTHFTWFLRFLTEVLNLCSKDFTL